MIDAPAPVPTPAPTASTPKPGLRKVSFGNLKEKKTSTKTEYPILPDPTGEIYALAKMIKQQNQELEAIEGALEANKAQLKRLTMPGYFDLHKGKTDVPSSVSIPTTEGEVLVTFSSRYKQIKDEGPILSLLGEDLAGQYFKQTFLITVNGDALPMTDPANPDRCPAQEFVDAFRGLVEKFGVGEAVTHKDEIKPTKEFHEKRHSLLTPDQNMALDDVCPMVAMVKMKGRDAE